MKSSEGQTARLRTRYTGEPVAAALTFFRDHGLHFGLVPDATDRRQLQMEAVLLRTLARPHPALPPLVRTAGTAYGLTGVSPGVDRLLLWPAPDQLPQLLTRLLPTRTAGGEVGGVPGLRAHPLPSRRSDTLTLARAGSLAHVELRAHPSALDHARALAAAAGLEPLWETDASSQQEQRAWTHAISGIEAHEMELWSRALRRLGLAITSPADWEHRRPEAEELQGPNAKRIAARASGPRAHSVRGTVAVIAADGRGGSGCTTIAYVLGNALARSGARVAVLGGDDPNGLAALLSRAPAPAGHWHDLTDHIPGAGTLQLATLPQDPGAAGRLIADARDTFDTVVVDAGNAIQQRYLAGQADAAVAVAVSQTKWFDTETIDHRPDKPRLWDWLDDRFQHFLDQENPTGAQILHRLLDQGFEVYAQERAAKDATSVYDAADEQAVDAWWLGYDERLHSDPDAPTRLPTENEAPHLQTWRADYLDFLSEEGSRRHPQAWAEIVATWAERNWSRNLDRLAPGEPSDEEFAATLARFRKEIEAEAVTVWNQELWSREWPLWEAADEEENRLREEHADLIESLQHPRPAAQVARELASQFRDLPAKPVVAALNRLREDVDQHHLADITEALHGEGLAGLALIPHLTEMQSWTGGSHALHPQALAVGWHLASQLTEALGARK